jgi:hypothetical protein
MQGVTKVEHRIYHKSLCVQIQQYNSLNRHVITTTTGSGMELADVQAQQK